MTEPYLELERAQPELRRLRLGVLAALALLFVLLMTTVFLISGRTEVHVVMWVVAGVLTLAGILIAWHIVAGLRHYGFALLDDGVLLCSGVWWRSEVFVPRVRIQHTDVAQGPLARKLDLATLVLHTAGVKLVELRIVGLRPERARQLRDELLVRELKTVDVSDPATVP